MIRTGAMSWQRGVVLVLPGVWVLGVVAWMLFAPHGTQAIQLLAATPAIACAGTGRRQCLVLASVCAVFALAPLGPAGRVDTGIRLGTCCAILAVAAAGYPITHRRRRLVRDLARAREIADAAQRVVLRPMPPSVDGMALASGHLSASEGTLIGGDLYEVLATSHGVRIVMGDVRGHGFSAIATVAAVLGSFREAAHDEAGLADVLRKLERALHRHLGERADARPPGEESGEEFVTVLLLEVHSDGVVTALNCGHPWPYHISRATGRRHARAAAVADGDPMPPLGLFPLPAELPVARITRLRPGEALVLHTDGAEDARDATGAFFPLARALTEAAVHSPLLVPAAVVEYVRTALLRHTGGRLSDDIALLALRNDRQRAPAPPSLARLARTGGPRSAGATP
ncbi:PP2C family protein-serine/threonine phosphatase [Streptomyces sp. UNOC14_S4]|uniref:PP2C family protein-serine/threonine phosphatase n=1 Tax=Streptomyces sp. UNOC14_S4 TaxID=2872340 RepID=UPI001E2DE1B3|nr:PP2C family protein-serine/threonine phosphatase [Streptomyces sp. UNOC14_S4]MCC3768032.1 serine/threonine-protein phosphatase [Streptomyces sp. UNOC14_S4]